MRISSFSVPVFIAMLFVSGGLMLEAARGDAPVMDELAHIPAGYSYVARLDYRLNPEHPPLVKALSAVPLLFNNYAFPETHPSWTTAVNGQWDFGSAFLYGSGNDAKEIVFLARIFPILLTLFLGFLVYAWGRERLGKLWALLPAFFTLFSPIVLAHGHYVTTDVGAAVGAVFSLFTFVSFLEKPSAKSAAFAGFALGVAELMKFSNVLLIPLFAFLAVIFHLSRWIRTRRGGGRARHGSGWLLRYGTLLGVAVLAVYLAYLPLTLNYPPERQASDTREILSSFAYPAVGKAIVAMSENPILRPAGEYLLGVAMVVTRSSGGNTGYFFGEISFNGWKTYFPAVYGLKETLPALIFILFAFVFSAVEAFRKRGNAYVGKILDYLGTNFHEFSMLLFVVLYWTWSIMSPLNIGVRHLLPTLPLLYLLAASGIKKMHDAGTFRKNVSLGILAVLVLWASAETAFARPYYLSYFNELGGGTQNGYRYVTDSNYDWGQDLYRLETWMKENLPGNAEGNPAIAVDYFGGGNIESLGTQAVPWNSKKGDPKDAGIEWLAVSVNTLSQAMAKEDPTFTRDDGNEYAFLRALNPSFEEGMRGIPSPDARAGTSIFIYHR
jgi:4-amino-4-deoxy-L-arabinose transferase-like glycosyltransferase